MVAKVKPVKQKQNLSLVVNQNNTSCTISRLKVFSFTSINTQVEVSIQLLGNVFYIMVDGPVSGQLFLFISPDEQK